MKTEITYKNLIEIQEIKKDCPEGHIESKGNKIYWVFEKE